MISESPGAKGYLFQFLSSVFFHLEVYSQRYLADIDSSFFIKDTVRPLVKRFENIRISGYIQPQYQVAQADGAQSFAGGNFSQYSRSRFMLRRARIRVDYLLLSKEKFPKALFVFQVDGTERGVIIRDMFMRLYETKKNNFCNDSRDFLQGLLAMRLTLDPPTGNLRKEEGCRRY